MSKPMTATMKVAISAVCVAFIALVIGSVSLGITSTNGQGTQGKEGPTGPIGTGGLTGATGVTGVTGVAGATGPDGQRGATGANGANGLIGVFSRTSGAGSLTGTTEATILNADFGVGSLVFPPNTISLGTTLCFVIGGFISTDASSDLTFRVLAGDGTILTGAVLLNTASFTPDVSMVNVPWNIHITIVNTLSSILVTNFTFSYSPSNSVQMRGITRQNSAPFTVALSNTLNVTALWTSAGSTLTYSYATLTRFY